MSTLPPPVLKVEVYSTGPRCMKCKSTMKTMDRQGITPAYLDLSAGAELPDDVQALNVRTAPIVIVRDAEDGTIVDHWEDHRPDLIKALAQDLQAIEAIPAA